MKNKTSKLVVALLALFCLTVTVFVSGMETKAVDNTYVTETYAVADAKPYFTGDTAPECKTDGYIFAGWYAETDTIETNSETGIGYFAGDPLRTLTGYTGTSVQALFVDAAVLGVKAQIAIMDGDDDTAKATPSDENVNIRFVTSVDTLKYQKLGLEVTYTYNGELRERDSVTNTVYKQITVADGTDGTADETMSPSQVFSARSQYFKAYTMTKIPMDAFETELSVRAYWETIDGARVDGNATPVIKTVQQGIYHTYEAGVDNTYYKVLETAVGTVGDTDTKTVTLFKNAEVESDMEITGNVTITNREGANITLHRAAGLTDANVFSVAADTDAVLNIVGTTGMDSIVLDGNNVSATVPMVHSEAGTLYIKNTTMQNAKCTSANVGGAVLAQSTTDLDIENTKFIGNTAVNGAAIRVAANTQVFITTSIFGELGKANVASNDGGAIYTQSKDIKITESQFLYNTTTRYGGAICMNGSTSVLNVTNSKFVGNTATGTSARGGAIFQPGSTTVTITAENDANELAIFENNASYSDTSGGGVIYAGGSKLTITGYDFKGNHSKKAGGAIYGLYGIITISDANFEGNYTTEANGYGGAVWISQKKASSIKDTTFTGNYTKGSGAHGGAVYLTANAIAGGTTITGSTFTGNYTEATDAVNTNGSELEGVYIAE